MTDRNREEDLHFLCNVMAPGFLWTEAAIARLHDISLHGASLLGDGGEPPSDGFTRPQIVAIYEVALAARNVQTSIELLRKAMSR